MSKKVLVEFPQLMEYLKPHVESLLLTSQLIDDLAISFIGCYLYNGNHSNCHTDEYIWGFFEDEDFGLLEPYFDETIEIEDVPKEVYETIQGMTSICVEQYLEIYTEIYSYLGFILQPLLSAIDGDYNYIHPIDIHVNESWSNVIAVLEIN